MSMQRTGVANLPLHTGKCPGWLFSRMVRLAEAISEAIIYEYGLDEFIKRISEPFWFQSLGNVLGFDWHSSGLTTTVCGALKEALNKEELGVKVAGGKGSTSKKAPEEIAKIGEEFSFTTKRIERLQHSSRMSAKVDSALLQDSYELYHHVFIINEKGKWAVIQQGLNEQSRYARRYHWLSNGITSFVDEPHSAICCDKKGEALDMTSRENAFARELSLDLVNDGYFLRFAKQRTLQEFAHKQQSLSMPPRHHIIDMSKRNVETLKKAYEYQPRSYEELVSLNGIGAKAIRSLALISELVYGKPLSWHDPAKYSFAHGGKDGIPYPVEKKLIEESAEFLKNAIQQARVGRKEKLIAIKRLNEFYK